MGEMLIQPFAAVRPRPELAAQICAPPYDVVSTEEARRLAGDNPLCFLRVSRPEIEFPPGTDPYRPEVYAQGRARFEELLRKGALFVDSRPAFYLYRLSMGGHVQRGLVAVASCAAYLRGDIRRHELTRPDKEDDRVRHIEALNAQTGPAYLIYRAIPELDAFLARRAQGLPEVDFVAEDGVRHTAWTLGDAEAMEMVRRCFAAVDRLYIADGHHRTAAAARVYQRRGGAGGSSHFLAVLFPHDQLRILPYHRVVRDLNGLSPGQLLERLRSVGDLSEGDGRPPRPHEVDLFLEDRWHRLRFRQVPDPERDPLGCLDVSLLQERVLRPFLGVEDPRTCARLEFVGGVHGPGRLEDLVRRGEAACAFALHPTGMEQLLDIADRGQIMPPKSTWFEPKLRDGMFSHLL